MASGVEEELLVARTKFGTFRWADVGDGGAEGAPGYGCWRIVGGEGLREGMKILVVAVKQCSFVGIRRDERGITQVRREVFHGESSILEWRFELQEDSFLGSAICGGVAYQYLVLLR